MPDLWEGESDTSDFELPGDAERLAAGAAEPEPEVEAPAEDRQRDPETGRFVAAEQPEVEAEVEPEAQAETQAERLLANKYANVDELEKAYVLAQAKLAERDEAKAQYERALAQIYQQQQQAQYQQVDWDEEISENPVEAAERAWAAGDNHRFQQAMTAWEEVSPGAPRQQLALQNAQLSEHYSQQFLGQKLAELEARVGPLNDHVDDIASIAKQFPMLMDAFGRGSPEQKAQALEMAAMIRQGLNTATLANAATEQARKLAIDEQRAREDAAVVSASRTNPQTQVSLADRLAEGWDDEDRKWENAWNV